MLFRSDNHIVAAFNVGRVGRLVFATKKFGNFCAKATKNLVGCIDDYPVVLNGLSVRELGAVANSIHFLIS